MLMAFLVLLTSSLEPAWRNRIGSQLGGCIVGHFVMSVDKRPC